MVEFVGKNAFLDEFNTVELTDVPGITGTVLIRELSAADRATLSMSIVNADGKADISKFIAEFPLVISLGMIRPKLTVQQASKQMPSSKYDALVYVATQILKISGMWEDGDEEKK